MHSFQYVDVKVVNILHFPILSDSELEPMPKSCWRKRNLFEIIEMLIRKIFLFEMLPNAWLFHKDQICYGHAHVRIVNDQHMYVIKIC